MKNGTSDVALELEAFASLLDAEPAEVQEAFQFLLATAMHEAGKFELLNVAEVDGRWHYTLQVSGIWASIHGRDSLALSQITRRRYRDESKISSAG